jgi:hypothetical protein
MAHRSYSLTGLALGALILAACTVGDPNAQLPGDDGVDARAGDGGGGGDGGGANCENLVTPAPDGHHNPGQGCIVGGCHAAPLGVGAPLYTVAGTLYTTPGGTLPKIGATILLPIAGTGMPRKLVTANNGNFWLEAASPLPTRPKASLCPTTLQMTNQAADGNCNSCHGAGSRIALP